MGKEGGAKETEAAILLGIRLSYIEYYLVIGRECRNAQENENCFRVWSVEKRMEVTVGFLGFRLNGWIRVYRFQGRCTTATGLTAEA